MSLDATWRTPILTVLLSALSLAGITADTRAAVNATSLGFRVNELGNGTINTGWTGGNLGNLWVEGEWVPYQLVLTDVQSSYPGLVGLPDIKLSYDFTKSGARFVDLVRGIQVGGQALTDVQAWPNDLGQPYPMTSKAEIKQAQNDVGNAPPYENTWQLGGAGNFTLLNLPESRVNRALDGTVGTVTTDRRMFVVTRADLIAAGVSLQSDTIVIYYQLHESRSFVWSNALQAALAASPTGAWGGYLYDDPPFSTDSRPGSSLVPGSSGHVHLESIGGSQDVPIPIPQGLPGAVSGLKWQDDDGNAARDPGEPTLSGWRITVTGVVDNIQFTASTLTDASGNYSFPNLTSGTWRISEALEREQPVEAGFTETYPNAGSAPVGAGTPVAVNVSGQATWGWSAVLSESAVSQGNLDFGNRACVDVDTSDLDDVAACPGATALFSTTATGTGPFTFVWRKGATVLSTGGDITITTLGAASSLSITNVEPTDAGSYSVTVSGECGTDAVASGVLTLNENVTATDLDDRAPCPGGTAEFTTTASGTGPFTFVWRRGATVLSTGGDITITTVGPMSTLSIAGVEDEDLGDYEVTVSGLCGPDAVRSAALTMSPGTTTSDLEDKSLCPGGTAEFSTTAAGTGPFSFVWKKGDTVLATAGRVTITTNGDASTLSIDDLEAGDAGSYSVTVLGQCGPGAESTADLDIGAPVDALPLEARTVCEGGLAEFSTTASGTGPFSFVWKKGTTVLATGGSITITTLGDVSTLSIANVTGDDGGSYSVTVTGACGEDAVRSALLTVNRNVGATGLGSRTICAGGAASLVVTASGAGPFSFSWEKDGAPLVPGGHITIVSIGNTSTVTIDPAELADGGFYEVTVSGLCGPPVTLDATIRVSDCVLFCSLTQGFYGNPGGNKCYLGKKLDTRSLIDALITPSTPLVVGKPGRSLRVEDGSEACLIKRLPGGGTPGPLPSELNDVTMSAPSCQVPNSLLKGTRFNNVLLSQAITLDLNLRLDPTLTFFRLCPSFVTIRATAGSDGCLGSGDDVPDPLDPGQTFTIPGTVLDALAVAGLPRTPVGLLELANRGLAGLDTYGASHADLAAAADAINRGFDECRFLLSCEAEDLASSVTSRLPTRLDHSGIDDPQSGRVPERFQLLANQPNPFARVTSIRFALPERSRVTISLFNVAGRRLATLVDREFEAGYRSVDWDAGTMESTSASGIYFYRLEGTGTESGRRFSETGRLVLLR